MVTGYSRNTLSTQATGDHTTGSRYIGHCINLAAYGIALSVITIYFNDLAFL
jgi:hypothetical protein